MRDVVNRSLLLLKETRKAIYFVNCAQFFVVSPGRPTEISTSLDRCDINSFPFSVALCVSARVCELTAEKTLRTCSSSSRACSFCTRLSLPATRFYSTSPAPTLSTTSCQKSLSAASTHIFSLYRISTLAMISLFLSLFVRLHVLYFQGNTSLFLWCNSHAGQSLPRNTAVHQRKDAMGPQFRAHSTLLVAFVHLCSFRSTCSNRTT